jgi:predicted kinase
MPERLILPRRTLLVLCGPAGSGKSTFVARRFPETAIVSSDRCRGMICDDENSQEVNRDAFDLFYYILRKRMALGHFCVADSVALTPSARGNLREISRHYGYLGCVLLFDVSPEICIQRDNQRVRHVGESVIRYHTGQMIQALQVLPGEGWDLVQNAHADLEIVIDA